MQSGETKPCAYCGKPVPIDARQCPYCREAVPEAQAVRRRGSDGGREIRRALQVPYPINPIVTVYLSPVLFFGGMGLSLYGVYLRLRS
jgi:hypothetical protein